MESSKIGAHREIHNYISVMRTLGTEMGLWGHLEVMVMGVIGHLGLAMAMTMERRSQIV